MSTEDMIYNLTWAMMVVFVAMLLSMSWRRRWATVLLASTGIVMLIGLYVLRAVS